MTHIICFLTLNWYETTRQVYERDQTPHFDFDTGDFAIALLQGGKGLPEKGWDGVNSSDKQNPVINQILDNKFEKTTIIIEDSSNVIFGSNTISK